MTDEYTLISTLEEFEASCEENFGGLDKTLEDVTRDLEKCSSGLDDMDARVKSKTDIKETARLWKETKRHPLNEDFKDLYNKTLLPMKDFQEQMYIYQSEHKQMREMIRNFDTTLLTKAGKVDFFEMRKNLDAKMSQEQVKQSEADMQGKIDLFKTDLKDLDTKLTVIQQSMSQGIYDAVKKANIQI